MKKKSLDKFKPFDNALSRYAEIYHAANTPPLPDNEDALDAALHGLLNSIERFYAGRKEKKSVRISIKV